MSGFKPSPFTARIHSTSNYVAPTPLAATVNYTLISIIALASSLLNITHSYTFGFVFRGQEVGSVGSRGSECTGATQSRPNRGRHTAVERPFCSPTCFRCLTDMPLLCSEIW